MYGSLETESLTVSHKFSSSQLANYEILPYSTNNTVHLCAVKVQCSMPSECSFHLCRMFTNLKQVLTRALSCGLAMTTVTRPAGEGNRKWLRAEGMLGRMAGQLALLWQFKKVPSERPYCYFGLESDSGFSQSHF